MSWIFPQADAQAAYEPFEYEEPRQWQVAADSVSNVTGKVFTKDGAPLSGKAVAISLNGGVMAGSDTTDAGGEFTITGLSITDGMVVSVYLNDETEKAVTVTIGSGTTMTGINLIENSLIIRNDSPTVPIVTDTNLKIGVTNGDSDILAIYDAADSYLYDRTESRNVGFADYGRTFTVGLRAKL
jgi:hypothetical protein